MYLPIAHKVAEIRKDAPNLKTYIFKRDLKAKPGQFVMVWLPGVDEVPMSVGWQTESEFHVGIANAGDCTDQIFKKVKVGDKLGIRGPYGNPFVIKPEFKKICVIGGGYGTPPLVLVSQEAKKKNIEVTAIIGARNKDYVIYEDYFEKLGAEILVSTDDGSKGHKGYNTEVLESLLKGGKVFDCIYTCGPEKMMVKVAQLGKEYKIPTQVSLERYMKCGFGACGQCCMDDTGIRICKEGPVLDGEYALKHPEFGKYARTSSGKLRNL